MFCLFTEIYWSLDEVILEQYWSVLYIGFGECYTLVLEKSPIVIISGKMATAIAHQRNILEIQRSVEVLS